MKIKLSVFLLAMLSLSVFVSSPAPALAEGGGTPAVRSGDRAGKGGKKDEIVYTVVKDDTLWGITGKFLDTPFKWPRVWKYNPEIRNPDLIYPGDIVRITPRGIEVISRKATDPCSLRVVTLKPAEPRVVVLEPEPVAPPPPPPPPAPTLSSDAIRRQGFISKEKLDASGAVIGNEERQIYFSEGDDIFLSLKEGEKVSVGDVYTAFIVGDEIEHPVTGKPIGYIIDILGAVRVTATGETVSGRIDMTFKEIPKGAKLLPMELPSGKVEITRAGRRVDAVIVAALEGQENLTDGDIVYLDKGAGDGLAKGNVMRIYRPGSKVADPLDSKKTVSLPPVDLGRLLVTETDEKTSTAVVIKSLQAIVRGDLVTTVDEKK